MQKYIPRKITVPKVRRKLREMPAVAIIGARPVRQDNPCKKSYCEKTSRLFTWISKKIQIGTSCRIPKRFFRLNAHRLICLDEIQRIPELFPLLRSMIDENNRNGQFFDIGFGLPGPFETVLGNAGRQDILCAPKPVCSE